MSKKRILVVEDQRQIAVMLVGLLESFGYEPLGPCDRGETAILLAGQVQPDLVLMDVNLGGEMDGVAAAEAMRLQFGVRAVLITALSITDVLPRAQRASPVGYLHKPFSGTALHTTIEMALHLRDVQAELRQNQQTLAAMLQTAPDGLMVTDLQGRILEANEAVCRITGLVRDELVGRAAAGVFAGGDDAERLLVEQLEAGEPRFVHACAGRHGEQLELTFRAHHEARANDRYVCFVRDISERKQAEEVLRASEHRLRLALAAGNLGAFEHDLADDRILGSPEFFLILGLPGRSSLPNREWIERVHPDDRAGVRADVAWMLREKTSIDLEYRLLLTGGEVQWIRVMASPVIEHGRVVRVYGVVQDVTERKVAESGLRQLSRAVEQSTVSIVITDLEGAIEYVNPAFCAVSGYRAEEVLGKNPRLLKSGDVSAETYRELWATLTAGEVWRGEFQNRKKSGELYVESASVSPIRDERGRVTHYVAVKEDITRQTQVARDLELRQSYLAAILENQPGPVWLKDNDERLLAVNRAFTRACGRRDATEVLGCRLGDIWGAEVTRVMQLADLHASESGWTQYALQLPTPDGARQWTEIFKSVARDSAGRRIGLVGCARDITAEKEAQSQLLAGALALQRTNTELQTALARQSELAREAVVANRAKSTFLASMSHELRSPLNVINGVSATLLREFPGTPQAGSAGLILECGEHLLGIIQEILDYSVLQGGHAKLDLKPVDLPELVGAVLRQIGVPAREKSLAVRLRLAPAVWPGIETDGRRLQQILLNLLQNAVKFTARGGIQLRVGAQARPDGRCRWTFAVFDSGIGLSRQQLDRLFKPFSQATAETAHHYGGTGLGLAISRSFAQLMGGDIAVRSVPGRGSCFRCSILARAVECPAPAAPPALLPQAVSPAAPPGRARLAERCPLRILAADDLRTNREVLRGMAAYFGYHADFCVNGVEVLGALARQSYDLLLLDVQMPVMDGLTTAREIHQRYPDAARRPRIVALTANALPGDREKCLAAGMDDYLPKPLLPEHLEACILHWFAGAPRLNAAGGDEAPPGGWPLIDRAHLAAAFAGLAGAALADVLRQLEAAALGDYEAALPRLIEACSRRDATAAAAELHALKGCFLTLGWKRLGQRCADLLGQVRAGKFSRWDALPDELRALAAESAAAMAGYVAQLAEPAGPASGGGVPAPLYELRLDARSTDEDVAARSGHRGVPPVARSQPIS